MNKKTIVSMSDKNYFELLLELIESIQRFPQSKDIDICVLDAGLTSEQKNILSKKVNEIITRLAKSNSCCETSFVPIAFITPSVITINKYVISLIGIGSVRYLNIAKTAKRPNANPIFISILPRI